MKLIKRNTCPIFENKGLEHLYTFKDMPIFMGCTNQIEEQDLKTDMSWWINKNSGLIQLNPLIPLDTLYRNSHGSGAVGKLWEEHHLKFAEFIKKFNPSKGVLEIGGGHGKLSRNYQEISPIKWFIVEPNNEGKDVDNIYYLDSFFDSNFKLESSIDLVIHSHVLEHIYYHNDFIANISRFISKGDKHIFSVPNMKQMLINKYNNCLNFEHTVFLVEDYIEYLLLKHGFTLIKKEYFKDDHSIFYCFEYTGKSIIKNIKKDLYDENLKIFDEYIKYHQKLIKSLNQKIEHQGDKVFLFGAHIFSQYLIAFGLNQDRIYSILDNDTNKQSMRLYGTSLNVFSPKVLKDIKSPKLILKAGVYNEEIKKDILNNINSETIFLE